MATIGLDPTLLMVLRRHNPWLDDPQKQAVSLKMTLPTHFVPRATDPRPTEGRMTLVIGPRQAGKSTCIRFCLASLPNPLLVLHAEEPGVAELCRSPAVALATLASVMRPNTVLFFEEAQKLREAPLFFKGLVDLEPHRLLVATGSASFQLHARTRESLAGRARRVLLLPFSLTEVAATSASLLPALQVDHLRQQWERLLIVGGYPAVWQSADPPLILNELVEAFVLRDASDLHHIEHPAAFRQLLRLAAADTGNLVNLSTWAAAAGVSRDTVTRYLQIAEDSHVIRLVPPFIGGKRAEITSVNKVFFIDNGLRNTLFGGYASTEQRPDAGALWENAIYTELLKHTELLDNIYFWRSKNGAEVDFVVQRREQVLGIEVKASRLTHPRLSRSARSFIEAYRPRAFAVINANLHLDTSAEGVLVMYRRPWEIAEILKIF
jgi:predicted AAA+ superfamily ATPase